MKRLQLILSFLMISVLVLAQDEEAAASKTNYAFSFTPQYVITGGMRVDLDFKLADKVWLTIAPIVYYMDDSYMYDPESTSYTGVGGFLNFRYFPADKGMYAGMGLNYRYLDTEYSYYNDGVVQQATFNTTGFDIIFGYQFRLVEQLFMDLYLGWGFRYSIQDSNEEDKYWSDAFLDLAYSGFLPVAGLRLGFEF